MSAEHDHADAVPPVPEARPHDPRLDTAGEDHPGVQPLPFDLVALENTRIGLRILGLGVGLVSVGIAPAIGAGPDVQHWIPFAGWALAAPGFFLSMLAATIAAPTPHGPLPKWARAVVALAMIAATISSIVHCVQLFRPELSSSAGDQVAWAIDDLARVVLLALPWILWRFCQYRGLTGRAIVWLWIAMAAGVLTLALAFSGLGWLAFGYPVLGVITFFAAQHSARDVWLDAVYRNTKFHATNRSDAVVEPLRPGGEH